MNKNLINKMGRPTESKKDITIKVRIDEGVQKMLDYSAKKNGLSKSEIIRLGITKIYQETKGEL